MSEADHSNRRQLIYWRALATTLGQEELLGTAEKTVHSIASEHGLPPMLLDPKPSLAEVSRRHPEIGEELENLIPTDSGPVDAQSVRRGILYSKVLNNVFGPKGSGTLSAKDYNDWMADSRVFDRCVDQREGDEGNSAQRSSGQDSSEEGEGAPDRDWRSGGSGGAPDISADDLQNTVDEVNAGRGLMSRPDIKASLERTEKRLIDRMALREVLKDSKLVEKMTPSMALTEQLLRDKDNLEGPALANAKRLIRRFVDDLGDVLKREVQSASVGKVDHRVPPKRTFANLDLKRTIWKNLINWSPEEKRLYVDRLYYHHASKRTSKKTRLIIVVDQSGSMIPAMINCTILASIFAGLPKVDAHLIAFDTQVVDLTQWIDDPLSVLLHTRLGGGNDGPLAMRYAASKVVDPANTVMVWISDFYDYRELFGMCRAVRDSGVTFIPVGSVSGSGYFSLEPWFRKQFKQMGTPVLSGSLKTLVREMKTALPI